MPYLPRRRRRIVASRSRRTTRRRRQLTMSVPRKIRGMSRGKYHFKRTTHLADTIVTPAGGLGLFFTFQLTDLPNYTEFSALFDQFRINAVVIKFVPTWTSNDINPQSTALYMPNFHSALDFDGPTTAPTAETDLLQYQSYRMTRGHVVHMRKIVPCVNVAAYESALATAYLPKRKQFLDMVDVATQHFGMKIWIDAPNLTSNLAYKTYATYYFTTRSVR